ncbi:hypothetical protein tinsulaeT_17500 [Thalassotalea insulae]|uniref:DUF2489 domain-containing protein n=1 Tax=Thalassotalea insulae TaxID=2056778 RepID=A0ABQ6GUS4_9GAMM|nr:hypothetical protein [Thalassotalea insulae]GLX78410.1 hypothetical protein tinsulaeT_17500 [Thalassotalea insulae]
MVFSLVIIGIFVAVSIYFYFRAESLYRQLLIVKKDAAHAKKESKQMVDSIAVIAKKNEEFSVARYKRIKELVSDPAELELLLPLVNNFSMIFRESLRGKGQLHKVAKKCCDSYKPGHYKQLTTHIAKQDAQIKRVWSSNNLSGFIAFIEAMLIEHETKLIPSSDK